MRHLIIRFIYIALAALSVVSCNTTERGAGYIHIDLVSDVDASVELSPVTKAIIEASDDYIVEIGGESYSYGYIKTSGVELLAGTYSVKAYNCTADEAAAGKGKVRFASPEQNVELAVGQNVTVSLQCVMANSRFTFSYDNEFAKEFDISKSTIEVSNTDDFSGRSVVLENISDELYFSAGDNIYAKVTAYKREHDSSHQVRIGPYTAQAATSHNINIKYQAPVFDLRASAAHTYSDGVLTGTAVKLGVTAFSGIGASKFESWGATLTGNDNKVIRSFSSSQMPTAGKLFAMTVQNGMIYLPQGTTATLSVYIKLKTGETLYFEPAEKTITIEEKPKVDVVINAETSYSRYTAKLSSANESGTGDKVMNISASVTISDEVLAQIKPTMSFTYDGISMLTNTAITSNTITPQTLVGNESLLSGSDIIGQAWGSHTVAASLIFDGVTTSASLLCHVTGIPYEADPPANSGANPWQGTPKEWADDCVILYRKDEIYQSFYIPDSKSLKVSVSHEGSLTSSWSSKAAYELSVGGVVAFSDEYRYSGLSPKSKDINIDDKECVLSSDNSTIKCIDKSETGSTAVNSRVSYIKVLYR